MASKRKKPDAGRPETHDVAQWETDGGGVEPAGSSPPVFDPTAEPLATFELVEVLVPLAAPAPGFFPTEIEVELNHGQRETLQRIAAGIAAASKKHASGRAPNGASEAVKYLLNLVAAAEPLSLVEAPHESREEHQGG